MHTCDGASGEEVRDHLLRFLQSISHDPEESGSARPKTVRVILRIWGAPDAYLEEFNESCALLFETAGPSDRLALHWAVRNLSTTMGHSTGLIREQCPVW